jgi:two-component system KDP operon response regulator KdpE
MTTSAGDILIVDDEDGIRRALRPTLQNFGFTVVEAVSGEEALSCFRIRPFDAVLLDINMPGMGGIQTCLELRVLSPSVPILMLTVRDSQDDLVNAFEAGADDYITKPFHMRELTARLKAAVRRSRMMDAHPKRFVIGVLEVDPLRRMVKKNGHLVHLTPKEFDLLHYLVQHAGMPVPHSRLLRAVWGPEYGNEVEYLRTFVRQLRIKIEDNPAQPAYLLTDAYIGYRFCEPTPT